MKPKRSGPKVKRSRPSTSAKLSPSEVDGVSTETLQRVGPTAIRTVATLRELLRMPFQITEGSPGYEARLRGNIIARAPTPEKAHIAGTRAILNMAAEVLGVDPWYQYTAVTAEPPTSEPST